MTAVTSSVAELPEFAAELFAPHRYKVLYGGRGASRSWSVARVLLILAAQRPLRIGCFREFQKSIRDSVHRLLSDQIDLLELPGYVVTDREIRHRNGSLFLFDRDLTMAQRYLKERPERQQAIASGLAAPAPAERMRGPSSTSRARSADRPTDQRFSPTVTPSQSAPETANAPADTDALTPTETTSYDE